LGEINEKTKKKKGGRGKRISSRLLLQKREIGKNIKCGFALWKTTSD